MSTTLHLRNDLTQTTNHPPEQTFTTAPLRELTLMQRASLRLAVFMLTHTPAPTSHADRSSAAADERARMRRDEAVLLDHGLRLVRV